MRRASVCASLTAIVFAFTLGASLATAQSIAPSMPGGFIVMFQPGSATAARELTLQSAGAIVQFNYSVVEAAAITNADPNVIAALLGDSTVIGIVPDRVVEAVGS